MESIGSGDATRILPVVLDKSKLSLVSAGEHFISAVAGRGGGRSLVPGKLSVPSGEERGLGATLEDTKGVWGECMISYPKGRRLEEWIFGYHL